LQKVAKIFLTDFATLIRITLECGGLRPVSAAFGFLFLSR
jgi:hypothetical protein